MWITPGKENDMNNIARAGLVKMADLVKNVFAKLA